MVNVSNEYLEKINSVSKQVYWFGRVKLKNGTEYAFDSSNLAQGQTSIRKELSASKFGIGGTCSAELKISFMLDYDADSDTYSLNGIVVNRYDFYEAEIRLTFRLYLSDDNSQYEDVFLGTFIITEPERARLVLICTAYDYMQKFSKPCVSELQGSMYSALLSACNVCGVTLGNTIQEINHMVNGTKTIAEYDPKNQIQTWRDVVGFIAAILCGNAIIKNNKLYIIPYKGTVDRYVSSNDRVNLTLEDYTLAYGSITSINLRNNTEDKVEVNTNLMAYKLNANPLMQYTVNSARTAVLSNILTAINSLHVIPFKSEVFNDPSYELGDTIVFSDNHAENATKCIITAINIKLNGHMEISCEGDDPYLKQVEESASKDYAESTNGSVGDGVTFYDFISEEDVTIADGHEEEIFAITYDSNGTYRQELMAELKIGFASTEVLASNIYTENDIELLVRYYINGQEVTTYHPETMFTDGVSLLHLFYFWNSELRIPQSTLTATITVNGGALTILQGNNHARIMQSGTSYGESSNHIEYIDVFKEPDKNKYYRGESLDYTGLIVRAYYSDGHYDNITNQCTYTPSNGSTVNTRTYVNVDVNYTKDGKQYKTNFGLEVIALSWIEVGKEPFKKVYRVGEALDYSGMVVYGYYDNDDYIDITENCAYKPGEGTPISAEMNSIIVDITYDDDGTILRTTYDDLIIHRLLMLEVVEDPTKTEYFVGENIDLSGVQLNAEYTDDEVADVTSLCTFTPVDGTEITQVGSITVTASYTEDGVTKTAPIVLTVEKVMVEELIVTPPTKTTYKLGQNLDLTGINVIAKYNNGTTKDVTNDCEYVPSNGTTINAGTTVLQVKYTEDNVTVVETVDLEVIGIDGIEVTTPPTKVAYKVGETLDLSGIVVKANWEDGSKQTVTNSCTFSPQNGSTITSSTTSVTVTYQAYGQAYTDTVDLEIITLDEIVVTPPTRVIYEVGDTLDYTGAVVNAVYSDGSTKDVTADSLFVPLNGSTATSSTTVVTVTYNESGTGYTDTFELEILQFESIEVTHEPYKTQYLEGESLDLTGTVISGIWSNGATEDVTTQCTFTPADGTQLNPRNVNIAVLYTKNGRRFTENISIDVKEKEVTPFDLKYFIYETQPETHTIRITGFNGAEIAADNLQDLYIPATYEHDGVVWTIGIDTN